MHNSHDADLLNEHESSEHRRESDTLGAESELMHSDVRTTSHASIRCRSAKYTALICTFCNDCRAVVARRPFNGHVTQVHI